MDAVTAGMNREAALVWCRQIDEATFDRLLVGAMLRWGEVLAAAWRWQQ